MEKTYPKGVLARLQAEELEILCTVAEMCERLGITYFIDGGTCLGAVRHGGFIPWDDDIDIGIPHRDYLRFLELAPTELPEGFELVTYEKEPAQTAFWAKVVKSGTRFIDGAAAEAGHEQRIFADIFDYRPLDSDPARRERQRRRANFWQKVSYLSRITDPRKLDGSQYSLPLRIVFKCANLFIRTFFSKAFIKKRFEAAWEGDDAGELWINASYSLDKPCARETLFPTRAIEFAGKNFQGPNNTHQYLQDVYGDYMTLPPEDKRHTHVPQILDFGDGVNVMEQ